MAATTRSNESAAKGSSQALASTGRSDPLLRSIPKAMSTATTPAAPAASAARLATPVPAPRSSTFAPSTDTGAASTRVSARRA